MTNRMYLRPIRHCLVEGARNMATALQKPLQPRTTHQALDRRTPAEITVGLAGL